MTDPYKVLGVSPDASDDDVKKAYRELARKYHPDKYADTDLADLASEKMKEINAAYEEIQKIRSGAGTRGTYGQSGNAQSGGQSGYGRNTYQQNTEFAEVRQYINRGYLNEAERILSETDLDARNAEWQFLSGCIASRRGYYADAQRYFDAACQSDPYNMEYRMARDDLHRKTGGFGTGYGTGDRTDDLCDLCSCLLCANLCCNGRGGMVPGCC